MGMLLEVTSVSLQETNDDDDGGINLVELIWREKSDGLGGRRPETSDDDVLWGQKTR